MNYDDHGKLGLRLTLGVLMLFHGQAKLVNGIDGIVARISGLGLPSFVAYLVFLGELVAPLFLIAGVWTRAAALVVVGNMVVAILLAHTGDIFTRTGTGAWGIELQAFYLFTAVIVALLGAGRFSFAGARGRWN